ADLFPEKIAATLKLGKDKPGFKVADENAFSGFDAVKRLLDSPVDYVMLCQPPGFRPAHFELAVEAGKHVFLEKPVAVDPAGVRRVIAAGEKAAARKLGVMPGTQSRHSAKIRETVRRIHDGQIGEVVAGRIYFNTGYLWEVPRREGMSDLEWQIRNWYYFDWLSGDHIVEQHVHQVDVADWVLRAHPVRAVGVGGRQVRIEELYGNIYDHFGVDYVYPDDVHVFSMCRQWKNTPGRVESWFTGTKGHACIHGPQSGTIFDTRMQPVWKWEGQETKPQVQEHRDLIESIRKGEPINEARRIAETTLTSILGREAAYTGKVVKWDELLKGGERLTPEKWELGPHETKPVRRPGKSV
ncbi:MAG TPA: Gfo/Idh/MocA family oxidoreductase, partial [Planctomycetota bacterium]|nr:Gfo/Idh/MocA family oxidoreductase [Planctomycetota bacterium]